MPGQSSLLEQWVKDFEAKFYDINDVNKKSFIPTDLIYDLRHKSQCLGVQQIKTESRTDEIIYCYIPSNNQGLVLKREDGQIGPITSYGNISLEDFTIEHTPFNPQKESRIKKYAVPAFIGTIIPVTYLGFKKLFGHRKDNE